MIIRYEELSKATTYKPKCEWCLYRNECVSHLNKEWRDAPYCKNYSEDKVASAPPPPFKLDEELKELLRVNAAPSPGRLY